MKAQLLVLYLVVAALTKTALAFVGKNMPPVVPTEPKHALFVGHFLVNTEINQMLDMADELKKLGNHTATFIVSSIYADTVMKRGYEVIATPEIPANFFYKTLTAINDATDFHGYWKNCFSEVVKFSANFYEPALVIIKNYIDTAGEPDVIVASMFSDMAMDLAHFYDIPLAVNFAIPLGGFFDYEDVPSAPDPLLWGEVHDYQSFSFRLWKYIKFAKILSTAIPMSSHLNQVRVKHGLAPVGNPMDNLQKAAWLVSWPFGIDYARRLRPLTFVTGFITSPWTRPKNMSKSDQQLERILDKNHQGVVFCAFGSVTSIKQLWFDSIIRGISTWAKNQGQNAVGIVALKDEYSEHLDKTSIPENIILMEWTNQKMILAHNHTRAFITHCGQGSIAEGVHNQVPMLGFPIFADQPSNAHKLVEAGIGEMLHHREEQVSSETILSKLTKITSDASYKENLGRHYQISVRLGGAKKAASVLEDMMLLGHLHHLVPNEESASFWARTNFDVYAFFALAIGLAVSLVVLCMKFLIGTSKIKVRKMWKNKTE